MALDRLKQLSEVREPDPRHRHDSISLDSVHATIEVIQLHDSVPTPVTQFFETAKNLSLYSWFVYRFHPIADFVARASLEMALRAKWETVYHRPPSSRERNFKALLTHARDQGWIQATAFRSLAPLAKRRAEDKKLFELLKDADLGDEFSIVPATPEEIDAELEEIDLPARIVRSTPGIRNEIAHGSEALSGDSAAGIRTMAEVINQLFT